MIARMGSGWQVVMADLSMILFVITAAGLADAPPDIQRDPPPPAPAPAASRSLPALAAPVALWQGGAGAPRLAQWLMTQPRDPRLRLTIVAPAGAADAALALAREAGRPARIVLETDLAGPPVAALTYDQAERVPAPLARPLQPGLANNPAQEPSR